MVRLILALLIPSLALADVKVTLVNQVGPYGLNRYETRQLFDESSQAFKSLGINLALQRQISTKKGPKLRGMTPAQWLRVLVLWKRFFDARPATYGTLKLVVVPPWIDTERKLWIGGIANGTCTRKLNAISITNGLRYNAYGLNRWPHSLNAQVHEASHLLGASHDSTNENIMHPAVLYFVKDSVLPFNLKAKEEFKQCQIWN